MKNTLKTLLLSSFILSAASQSFASTEKYTLDPNHTNVFWYASHFGFSTVPGKFAKVEGELKLDEKKPENSSVNVTIHTSSIVTGIEKFDNHLKSEDFFNATQFPTITFQSKKIEVTGKDTAKISGILTILGNSKPVILDTKLNKIGIHPVSNKKTAGFSATATIKRSEFGISYAVPAVADEVKITIETEATLAN